MAAVRGGGSRGGLRAAWEQRQQAVELAAAAVRLPGHARSKPALLAAQLQPVLAALAEHAAEPTSSGGSVQSADTASAEWPHQALAAAAQHLRRLLAIDKHAGPNMGLLLMLLVGLAERRGLLTQAGEEGLSPAGCLLVRLLACVGWQRALLQALPLLGAQPRRQLQRCLVGLASRDGSSLCSDQAVPPQLVSDLAEAAQEQLEAWQGGGSGSQQGLPCAGGQLERLELLQQLLLLCPAAGTDPTAAAALQRLQASTEACMAGLMGGLQQAGPEGRQQLQPLFQQLCQLRGRLTLSLAFGAASSTGSEGEAGPPPADTAAVPAAHVWRQVLQAPASVAAAAAKARRAAAGAKPGPPSQQQLLAACVAATCLVQALPDCTAHCAQTASRLVGHGTCAALPGVLFERPPFPELSARSCGLGAGSSSGSGSSAGSSLQPGALAGPPSPAAAAEAACAELERDADCLAPARLVLACLRLAEGQGGPAGPPRGAARAAAWERLLELAAAAAAEVAAPSQQRHLLLAVLHGGSPWQARLRQALATDAALQRRCGRELVGVFNRLASDTGSGGGAVVHGEERRRRTAAAVLALLPHALLCPAAVLRGLVRQAVVQAGEQVELLLDVLREMWPLAALPAPSQHGAGTAGHPLLLSMLASLLAPRGADAQAPALDTPASQDAFLQLAAGLCGVPAGKQGGMAAPAAAAGDALLSPTAVAQHVVAAALQQHGTEGEGEDAARLLLPLRLAELLLGGDQGRQLPGHLRPVLGRLLDPAARRVDVSAAALQPAAPEVAELAAALAQRVGGAADRGEGVAAYLRRQLEQTLQGQPPPQQLAALRHALLRLLAALLPCCTAGEARQLLLLELPATVQAALGGLPPAGPAALPPSSAVLPGAHAAAMEAACRAARMLGLQPGQAPIAGEEAPPAAGPPSALRQVAVERVVQHLTQHSVRLAAASQPGVQLAPADCLALGQRCFRELCQLAAALEPAGYGCSTLQAGLLQLVQQLLQAAAAPGAACSPREVREALAAAAAGLPAGHMRGVVLAAIERAGGEAAQGGG